MRKRFYIPYNIQKESLPVTSLYDSSLFEIDFDNIHNFVCEGIISVGQEEISMNYMSNNNRFIGRTTASLKLILRNADNRTLNQIKDWIGAVNETEYRNFRKSGVIRKLSNERVVLREYALRGVSPESITSPVLDINNYDNQYQFEIDFFIESIESFID